jgi:hypothetical protein
MHTLATSLARHAGLIVLCPLLALSGHGHRLGKCPLLGVKRTSVRQVQMSAFDPGCVKTLWLL